MTVADGRLPKEPAAPAEHSPAKSEDPSVNFRRSLVLRTLSIASFFILWEAVSLVNFYLTKTFNPILVPTPIAVFQTGMEMIENGELLHHIVASLSRVVEGFLIAAVSGIAIGTIVGRSRLMEEVVDPVVQMLRPIPPFAFLPMMVLWFGIGEGSKVVFIAYSTFFPVFLTTAEGTRHVNPTLLRAAASLGASRRDLFWYVVLPNALPAIFTGLRLAFGLAWFVIIAAEFVAADAGVGFLINDSRTYFDVRRMLLGAVTVGLIGFSFDLVLLRIEAFLLRWRVSGR
jgi:ABC-type nitrate/sulfonate/bicarbonate transport system permease component